MEDHHAAPMSPNWASALPAGPDTRVKITEAYAKLVARDAYFWAWPMVNIFNRRQAFKDIKEIVMAGPVPSAPLNRFAMLTDYITPDQRLVCCPNQDVVYGAGSLALEDFAHQLKTWMAPVGGVVRPASSRLAPPGIAYIDQCSSGPPRKCTSASCMITTNERVP